MAGHRKAKARPARQQRGSTARGRLSTAATAEEQLAAIYDLFRVTARGNAPLMRRAAEFLMGLSDGGNHGHDQ